MSAAQTPGPWTATPPCREDKQYHWAIRGPGRSPQVVSFEIARLSSANTPELEHDARLIAAAPDLLEALQFLVECSAPMTGQQEQCWISIRAAIAKATGKNP